MSRIMPGAPWRTPRLGISILVIVTLISTNVLVCNSQLNKLALWRVGMVVGIGSLDNLFQLTDQPVIFSPNKQYYLAVQAKPANNALNPGDEFFCWLSVVNQSIATNKTNIWRAPCDQELQRSNDSMQLCYFGISADGNLLLSHDFAGSQVAFSSNTTGLNVDQAIVDDSGSVLLRTASNLTVWTSADHQTPASCLGSLKSLNTTLRTPPANSPQPSNTSLNGTAPSSPPGNSAPRTSNQAFELIAIVGALIFALQFLD